MDLGWFFNNTSNVGIKISRHANITSETDFVYLNLPHGDGQVWLLKTPTFYEDFNTPGFNIKYLINAKKLAWILHVD